MPRGIDVFLSTFSDTVAAFCFAFDTDCNSVDSPQTHPDDGLMSCLTLPHTLGG